MLVAHDNPWRLPTRTYKHIFMGRGKEIGMGFFTVEVTLIANATAPLTWSIEAVNSDGDGGIDLTIFSGPTAEQRAREYSGWKYGVREPRLMAA
jgi:hypothetical protein